MATFCFRRLVSFEKKSLKRANSTIFSRYCRSKIMNNDVGDQFRDILSDENKLRLQNCEFDPTPLGTPLTEEHKQNQAAVLIPLCVVNGHPSILFTLRSTKLLKHRGEVSFPGGRFDESDGDVLHTALRETEEELGIGRNKIDVWMKLRSFTQTNRFGKTLVTPFLANLGTIEPAQLTINHDEVEDIFCERIQHLCDSTNIRTTHFKSPRSHYVLPVYLGEPRTISVTPDNQVKLTNNRTPTLSIRPENQVELTDNRPPSSTTTNVIPYPGHKIWGLTAAILHLTLTVLAPKLYTFTFDRFPRVYKPPKS